jgi:hypothetical protein
MFRISKDLNTVIDVAQVDEIELAVRGSMPGRYHIDQIERGSLPLGHTSRRWGVGLTMPDGSVVIARDPWGA